LNGLLNVDLGTINLPVISEDGTGLLDLGQAGALSSYAIADTPTHAKASAGVLGADGALAVDTAPGDMATIDLTKLFGQLGLTDATEGVLSTAELQLGALASSAERKEGGQTELVYQLAGATVELESPLVSELGGDLTAATSDVATLLESITSDAGLLGQLSEALSTVNVTLEDPLLGTTLAQLGLSNVQVTAEGLPAAVEKLNTLISNELVSEDG
ncbi:hypothetical protein BZG21_37795, partial [Escherichia coli]|nr:hypothetical protein [Escherichia coli]